eukprot:2791389-Prymnesium_polylepis.2
MSACLPLAPARIEVLVVQSATNAALPPCVSRCAMSLCKSGLLSIDLVRGFACAADDERAAGTRANV